MSPAPNASWVVISGVCRVPGFLALGPAVLGRAQVLFHLSQLLLQGRQLGAIALVPVERRVGDGLGEVFLFRLQLFDLGDGPRQSALQVLGLFSL